jgi:hypothetical protein
MWLFFPHQSHRGGDLIRAAEFLSRDEEQPFGARGKQCLAGAGGLRPHFHNGEICFDF